MLVVVFFVLMWPLILVSTSKAGLIHQWTPKQTSFMSKKYLPEKNIHLMKIGFLQSSD